MVIYPLPSIVLDSGELAHVLVHHVLCVGDAYVRKDPKLLRLLSVAMVFGSDCTVSRAFYRTDPNTTRGTRSRSLNAFLVDIYAELLRDQHDLTQSLVHQVVDAVLDGKVVCVMCMMGKYRSQAVASLACKELERSYAGVVYEGPVYLLGISKTH